MMVAPSANLVESIRTFFQTTRIGRRTKNLVRVRLAQVGLELVPFSEGEDAFLGAVLARCGVTCVLDVGANGGQYGLQLRRHGYRGPIISFEPLPDAYGELARVAAADGAWITHQLALGSATGEMMLHVAANSVSSSLLPPGAEHVRSDPNSRVESRVEVPVRRLDDVVASDLPPERVCLKVDVQGFELSVLLGASGVLDRVSVLQCELGLRPLYEGQTDYIELLAFTRDQGFDLVYAVPAFTDRGTSEMLQLNAIFRRR